MMQGICDEVWVFGIQTRDVGGYYVKRWVMNWALDSLWQVKFVITIGEILDGLAAPSNIDQGLTLPNLAVMST
jgi:hypothetical protein